MHSGWCTAAIQQHMPNGYGAPAMNGGGAPPGMHPSRVPQAPPGYNYAAYGAPPPSAGPPAGFMAPLPTGFPPQPNGAMPTMPPNRGYNQSPLQAPPTAAGLPARPPPSIGGYGGPSLPPGMQAPFPGGAQPPQGFAPSGPPPGFRPPGNVNGYPPPAQQQQR